METPCCCSPSLATKGQGYVLLWLIFIWLWTLGACSPETSDTIWPSTTVWTSPAPSPQLQTASFIPEVTASFQPLASDPSPTSLSESTVNVQEGISVSVSSSWVTGGDGDLLSTQTHVDASLSEPLQSSLFVSPSVSLYPTPVASLRSSDFWGSFIAGGWEQTAPAGLGDSSSSTPLIISSTLLVDSVAVSLLRDPTVGLSDSGAFVSYVQSSTRGDSGTATAALPESSTFVLVASATALTPSSSEESVFQNSRGEIEGTSSAASQVSSVTGILVMNSTQTSTIFQPSAGETTSSLLNSTPEVSSLGPSGGNGSCTERDTGCVEYRGDEDEEEEERRIKIIIGAACGAVLLVVILGVFIGCVLKRRGKMPSGSKIDLSSYWDDSVTLSYINGHVDIPKDSADEMISLDNDSFLNSLDSMSFTNTWTSDTSKHTNF